MSFHAGVLDVVFASREYCAMKSIDLISENVQELGAFLKAVAPVEAQHEDPAFSSYISGDVEIMISPAALIPMTGLGGVILHFVVEDVRTTVSRAAEEGYTPTWGPAKTDWGTFSALFTGPEGLVVDIYSDLTA